MTNAIITRTNWIDNAVLSGGSWSSTYPLANIKVIQPEIFAQAASADSDDTKFDCDLGTTRLVRVFSFQNLATTTAGTIRVRAGIDATFTTTTYDSTAVSSWPLETSAWGDSATKYEAKAYQNLGYPRYFVAPSDIDCRYVRVEVVDTGASPPLQIGHFGVWEGWQFTYGQGPWAITSLDGTLLIRTDFGTTFVTPRKHRQRISLPFEWINSIDFLQRLHGIALTKGKSYPVVVISDPDAGTNMEKTSIYGLLSEVEFTRHQTTLYSATLTIEQL